MTNSLKLVLFAIALVGLVHGAVISWDTGGRENVMLSSIVGGPLYYPASSALNFQTYPNLNASSCDTDEGCTLYPHIANGSWSNFGGTSFFQWRSAGDPGTGSAGPPFWIIVDLHRQVSISEVDVQDGSTTSARQWTQQALILGGNYTANNVTGAFKTINSTTSGFQTGGSGNNYTFTFNSSQSVRFVMIWINATVAGTNAPNTAEIAIRGEDAGANYTFNGTTEVNKNNSINYSFVKTFGFKNATGTLYIGSQTYPAYVTNDSNYVYLTTNFTNTEQGVLDVKFRILQFTNDTNGANWNTSSQTQYSAPYPVVTIYNTSVASPSTQKYAILIGNINDTLGVNSTFYINGTNYTSTSTLMGGQSWHNITATFNLVGTQTFWWQISFLTSSGYQTFNTSTYTQTWAITRVYECNLTNNTRILVYYLKDEENQLNITGTMSLDMYYSGATDVSNPQNFSLIRNNTNNLTICIDANTTIYANTYLSYYNGSTYPARYHYFLRQPLSNATFYQTVYTNPSTIIKLTKINILSEAGVGLKNSTLKVERYYTGNNSYLLVAMTKTDDSGNAITYLRPNDVYHRVTLLNLDGSIRKVLEPFILQCDNSAESCTYDASLVSSGGGVAWNYQGQIGYACSYTNATTLISCALVDNSGTMTGGKLTVYKQYAFNQSTVECVNEQSGTSVVLNCLVNNTHGNSFVYLLTMKVGTDEISIYSKSLEFSQTAQFGYFGLLMAILLITTLALIANLDVSGMIILVIVGLTSLSIMGFIALGAPAVAGIIIVGIVLAWLAR